MWLAWWVVFSHAINLGGEKWLPNSWEALLSNGAAPVNLFVIVSGFVVTHLLLSKNENYPIYLMRRFLRIAPIYLFCLVIAIWSESWFRYVYGTLEYSNHFSLNLERLQYQADNYWAYFISHVFLLHGLIPDTLLKHSAVAFLSPAWSLSLEWQFYLIAPILFGLIKRSLSSFLTVSVSLLIFGLICRQFWFIPEQYWLERGELVPLVVPSLFFVSVQYFLIGIISRLLLVHLPKLNCSPWLLMLALMTLMQYLNTLVGQIWAVIFCFCLFEAGLVGDNSTRGGRLFNWFMYMATNNGVVRYMGRISYSTYLAHIPIFVIVVFSYDSMFGAIKTREEMRLAVTYALVAVLILSPLLYEMIEKPFINLGRRLAKRMAVVPSKPEPSLQM